MATRQQKEALVDDIRQSLSEASIVVIADYRGLRNDEMMALRRSVRQQDATFTVLKNTLAKRAISGTDLESISPFLKGPTALLMGKGDQVGAVKALRDYLKLNKKENELRGAFLEGSSLDAKQLAELADLPTLDVLRGKLLMCIASPLTGLAGVLAGSQSQLVRALQLIAEQKEQASA